MASLFALAAAGLASVGCGDGDDGCVDRDRDGFEAGCAAGTDCDDTNPLRTDDCAAVPPPDCDDDPTATGCPCIGGVTPCYPGPAGTEGVGLCTAGQAECVNGHWGLCRGAVVPEREVCDGRDQSCDGVVDEGVTSPCGGCDESCEGGVWGTAGVPFVAGAGADVMPDGSLTLARERLDAPTVWVANSAEGTLSRIDAASAIEEARYDTGGAEPSRVAVDYNGDAWVTNRAFGGTSSVTKVIAEPARCPDRDGDGLETSTGPTDVLAPGEDECVAFTVPVGEEDALARALAIDGSRGSGETGGGHAWVGLEREEAIVELDGDTGAELDRVDTPGFAPYDAAIDPWGVIWMISRDGLVARIDRRQRPLSVDVVEVPYPCFQLYGVASDAVGRLAMTGFSCDRALMHDPRADIWWDVDTPQSTRGVTVVDGVAWVTHTDGRLSHLALEPFALEATHDLTGLGHMPLESIGVSADTLGGVWVASSQGGLDGLGVATRVEAATGEVTDQVTVGLGPHVQGDLTGGDRLGGFAPEGTASHVFEGCDGGTDATRWTRVHLDADAGTAGSVRVEVRHAADRDELTNAPFATVLSFPDENPPADLTLPEGGVVEVRLTLATTAHDGAPRVRRVGLEWDCGPLQ
ncbi:MAG: hypothetical protein ACOCXM_03470 [Myxococcota bacterium]